MHHTVLVLQCMLVYGTVQREGCVKRVSVCVNQSATEEPSCMSFVNQSTKELVYGTVQREGCVERVSVCVG